MCPVGAIFVAKTQTEYDKIKKQIDKDPRKVSDLFIDRYGTPPLTPAFISKLKNFKADVLESTKTVMVEIYNEGSIMCLLKSIPLKNIVNSKSMKFCKIDLGKDTQLMDQYKIKKLPSLLFFKSGKLIGKIEGHYDLDHKEIIKAKIAKILKK
jgi:hypothetical protein